MGGLSTIDKIQLMLKGYTPEQIEEFAKKVKKHKINDIDEGILRDLM